MKVLKIPGIMLAAASIIVTSMSIGFLSATLEPHLRQVRPYSERSRIFISRVIFSPVIKTGIIHFLIIYFCFAVRAVSSGLGADVRHKRRHVRADGAVVGLAVRQSVAREGGHVTRVHHTHGRVQSHRARTVPEQTDVSRR